MELDIPGAFEFTDYEFGGRRGSDTDLHFDWIFYLLLL